MALKLVSTGVVSSLRMLAISAAYGPEDRITPGGGLPEEGEQIRVLEMPLDRAWEMVLSGRIIDAKTVLLLQHLRLVERAGAA